MIVAKTIICVMYNAIKISDVTRSQLQSSGRKLGLKNLNKEDKNTLACLVAKSLLDNGYVKIVPGKSRDDIYIRYIYVYIWYHYIIDWVSSSTTSFSSGKEMKVLLPPL